MTRTDQPTRPSLHARLIAFFRARTAVNYMSLPERRGPRITAAERRESVRSHERLDAKLT